MKPDPRLMPDVKAPHQNGHVFVVTNMESVIRCRYCDCLKGSIAAGQLCRNPTELPVAS